jgi:ectoine hydroxylase-related dioxygenase (phytanoyl-CoA dioxygenase family)
MRYLPRSHARGLILVTRSDAIKAGQAGEPDDVRERLESRDHGLADGQVDVPLRAGEAMIHHGLLIHGSAANATDRLRRAYAMVFIPSDTRYTGQNHISTDHLGLTPQTILDHPDFPVIY